MVRLSVDGVVDGVLDAHGLVELLVRRVCEVFVGHFFVVECVVVVGPMLDYFEVFGLVFRTDFVDDVLNWAVELSPNVRVGALGPVGQRKRRDEHVSRLSDDGVFVACVSADLVPAHLEAGI